MTDKPTEPKVVNTKGESGGERWAQREVNSERTFLTSKDTVPESQTQVRLGSGYAVLNVLTTTETTSKFSSLSVDAKGHVEFFGKTDNDTVNYSQGSSSRDDRAKLDPKLAKKVLEAARGFMEDGVIDAREASSVATIVDSAKQSLPKTSGPQDKTGQSWIK